MRAIEDALSVIGPDICGSNAFVDEKHNPVCPIAHVLKYNGERLEVLFKRHQPQRIRNLSFTLGVLQEALQEFIIAWDYLVEQGQDKRAAFDKALTAAEKIEDIHQKRKEAQRKRWDDYGRIPYVNVLDMVKLTRDKRKMPDTGSVYISWMPEEGWKERQLDIEI